VEVQLYSFLTSALYKGRFHALTSMTLGKKLLVPSAHYEARWAPQPVCTLLRREKFLASCWKLNHNF